MIALGMITLGMITLGVIRRMTGTMTGRSVSTVTAVASCEVKRFK